MLQCVFSAILISTTMKKNISYNENEKKTRLNTEREIKKDRKYSQDEERGRLMQT